MAVPHGEENSFSWCGGLKFYQHGLFHTFARAIRCAFVWYKHWAGC